MNKIKDSGADGVYIGGVFSRNGRELIRDKRSSSVTTRR